METGRAAYMRTGVHLAAPALRRKPSELPADHEIDEQPAGQAVAPEKPVVDRIAPGAARPQRGWWRRVGPSLLLNGLAPYLVYALLHRYSHLPELWVLVATGLPSLAGAALSVARTRRMDFLAGAALFTVALSLGLLALGGSARLYLVRESFVTAAYGAALLGSLASPRPLTYYTARYFIGGNDPDGAPWFDAAWTFPPFRAALRQQAMLWGSGALAEAAVRTGLVIALPVSLFLVVSPFVLYGIIGLLGLFGARLMTRWQDQYGVALRRHTEPHAESAAPPPAGAPARPADLSAV
jgi:hypothetical protein